MKTILKYSLLFLFLCSISLVYGQKQDLTLEKLYKDSEFKTKGFGPARWLKDGSGYTTLEASASSEGKDIIKYNPKTGKRIILVSALELIPEGKVIPLLMKDYKWSDDGAKLLIFTNTRRVWRYHTRGDYWVLNLKNGKLQRLGKSLKSTTLMFAKFSPDSKKVAYVSEQNVYVEHLSSEKITALTNDGGANIINGTFDWAYEEELGLRDGFRWSPDSKQIAYFDFLL